MMRNDIPADVAEKARVLHSKILANLSPSEDITMLAAYLLEARAAGARQGAERMREALVEAEETLRLVEHPAFPDPVHHERVKSLGCEIGFGALMSTAAAAWREVLKEKGWPPGGEFVAGPCLATVQATLQTIRAALLEGKT